MVGSDGPMGSLGRWDLESMETKGNKGKREVGGLMIDVKNEQVLWWSKKVKSQKVKN